MSAEQRSLRSDSIRDVRTKCPYTTRVLLCVVCFFTLHYVQLSSRHMSGYKENIIHQWGCPRLPKMLSIALVFQRAPRTIVQNPPLASYCHAVHGPRQNSVPPDRPWLPYVVPPCRNRSHPQAPRIWPANAKQLLPATLLRCHAVK